MLPENLRLAASANLISPDTLQQFRQNWRQQYANPAEGQLQSQLYSSGRADSTFGGAQLGQLQGMNNLNELQAALGFQSNALENWLKTRQSFFGNEGQMAQNANQMNVNRGLGVAQMSGNAWQSQANAQNEYNLNAYRSMLQAQQQREQSNFQNMQSVNENRLRSQQIQMPTRTNYVGMGTYPEQHAYY
jgi:hypothetical protein